MRLNLLRGGRAWPITWNSCYSFALQFSYYFLECLDKLALNEGWLGAGVEIRHSPHCLPSILLAKISKDSLYWGCRVPFCNVQFESKTRRSLFFWYAKSCSSRLTSRTMNSKRCRIWPADSLMSCFPEGRDPPRKNSRSPFLECIPISNAQSTWRRSHFDGPSTVLQFCFRFLWPLTD